MVIMMKNIIFVSSGSRFGSGSVPLRAARSSVEGLNQEIERLVLYPASGTQTPHLDRLRDKVRLHCWLPIMLGILVVSLNKTKYERVYFKQYLL